MEKVKKGVEMFSKLPSVAIAAIALAAATAMRMLKDGVLALKDIAKFSGLSLAQVKKLQASMA